MTGLETVATDQKRWALTANKLKIRIQLGRRLILGLAIAGAIFEALAAQIRGHYPTASEAAGYAGAAALALVVVVKSQGLGRVRLQAWILARAAAESFKREIYYYRTSSGPYGGNVVGNPDSTLFERRDEILGKVRSIQRFALEPDPTTVTVGGPLDADAYISERVNGQIKWFRNRASEYSLAQGKWETVEYILAAVGALLGATLTFNGKQEFGAWVAVVTTISGAVGGQVLAERYDQLAVSFRTSADRLTGILGRWRAASSNLSKLVEQVEAALLEENQGWIASADELMREITSQPVNNSPRKSTPASSIS
jgi:hypothetical protein